jgi:peptidoglycan-associated lipoprotein
MKFHLIGMLALGVLLTACGDTPPEPVAVCTSTEPTDCIVKGSIRDLVVNVGDRVFFEFDSSKLSDAGKKKLEEQVAWLNQYPAINIQVGGFCDERGSSEYNLALGERRANEVASYLKQCGLNACRILSVCSAGKEKPFDTGHNEEAWAKNRTAVTLIQNGSNEAQACPIMPGAPAVAVPVAE